MRLVFQSRRHGVSSQNHLLPYDTDPLVTILLLAKCNRHVWKLLSYVPNVLLQIIVTVP